MSTIKFELSKKMDATKRKQILVRVSVSREFRVGGKTKIYVASKDWNEKKQAIRKASKIEKVEKQRELEDVRKLLNDLQDHISRAIIDNKDIEKMGPKKKDKIG